MDSQTAAILAPLGDDAAALARVADSCGLEPRICATSDALADLLEAAPDGEPCLVLIAQEGADERAGKALASALDRAPSWSRLPVIFLIASVNRLPPACRIIDEGFTGAIRIVLERPVRPAVLQRQFHALVEVRRRQLETGELMAQLRLSEERQRFLLRELRHRMSNILTVLQSLFSLTARHETDLKGFLKSFSGRLKSFSDAHQALGSNPDETRELSEMMRTHVLPHCIERGQLRYEGPQLWLPRDFAFQLALVVHELAINAAKHGALSREGGVVTVSVVEGEERCRVTWEETGGPPVEAPQRRGLGSALVRSFAYSGAEASSEYRPSGFVWELTFDAGLASGSARTASSDRDDQSGTADR